MTFCFYMILWGVRLPGISADLGPKDVTTISLFLLTCSACFARMSLSLIHSTLTGSVFSPLQLCAPTCLCCLLACLPACWTGATAPYALRRSPCILNSMVVVILRLWLRRIFLDREPLVPLAGIVVASYFPEHSANFLIVTGVLSPVSFFAHHICHQLAYAKALGVNVITPPSYGPDGKAIKIKAA